MRPTAAAIAAVTTRSLVWVACVGWVGFLTACQHSPNTAVPAMLSASAAQPACLQQMQAVIERDLGQPVRITAAAFASSASLAISPAEVLDPQGRVAQGRIRGMPQLYELRKNASNCEMRRSTTGEITALSACSCVAAQ